MQGVYYRFALVVVVGDHVGVAGVLLDVLDAGDPGIEFLGGIEIVVTFMGGGAGIVAEPGVVTAAVKAHVADGRGGFGGGLEGVADDGLIDVAEAGVVFTEELQGSWILPGGVAKFDDERIVGKALKQGGKMRGGFGGLVKGKRELQEDGAEFFCVAEDVEAGADGALVFGAGRGFMGEALPEFCGEEEGGIGGYAIDPGGGVFWADWLVEGSVDFDGVEKLGEESCFVEAFRAAGWIDVAGPVRIGPAGGADAEPAWSCGS